MENMSRLSPEQDLTPRAVAFLTSEPLASPLCLSTAGAGDEDAADNDRLTAEMIVHVRSAQEGYCPDEVIAEIGTILERFGEAAWAAETMAAGMRHMWASGCLRLRDYNDDPMLVDAFTALVARTRKRYPTRDQALLFDGAEAHDISALGRQYLLGLGVARDAAFGLRLLLAAAGEDEGARALLRWALSQYAFDLLVPEFAPSQSDLPDTTQWRQRYPLYLQIVAGKGDAAEAARQYLKLLGELDVDDDGSEDASSEDEFAGAPVGRAMMAGATVWLSEFPDLIRFAELVSRFEPVAETVLKEGTPRINYMVATLLFEGLSEAGKDIDRGVMLLRRAADAGLSEAQLRLAQITEQGYGVDQDHGRALQLYRQAAENGQLRAHLDAARMYEDGLGTDASVTRAEEWYRLALMHEAVEAAAGQSDSDYGPADVLSGLIGFIQERLAADSAFIGSPAGQGFLLEVVRASPILAGLMGDAYACDDCGIVIDLTEAAKWFRIGRDGGDADAAYKLARLLMERPELAVSPDELALTVQYEPPSEYSSYKSVELLKVYLDAIDRKAGDDELVSAVTEALRRLCSNDNRGGCLKSLHNLATGGIDHRLVAPALDMLRARVEHPEYKDQLGSDAVALTDILAFYGDFKGALAVLTTPRKRHVLLTLSEFNARNTMFRRLVTSKSIRNNRRMQDLDTLLRELDKLGDDEARHFRALLQESVGEKAADDGAVSAQTLQELTTYYETHLNRGGISNSLVQSARALARAWVQSDDAEKALELELFALNTELEIADISQIWNGAVPAGLRRACMYSRASSTVFALGYSEVALALGGLAVNELQGVRRRLSALPEEIQLCFRDSVSDHYRWLANLYAEQDRPADALFVLGLLKDFETFRFVERSGKYVGDSLKDVPLSESETRFQQAVLRLTPPLTVQARRARELKRKSATGELTEEERTELEQLERELDAHRENLRQLVAEIISAARAAGREDQAERVRTLRSMQSYLRKEMRGEAVAIHFVVLPEKMSAILLTGSAQKVHIWEDIDGAPFTEAGLDRMVQEFRGQLATPYSDPRAAAGKLYDLLLRPFREDIDAIDAKTVILSLDRRLRYVPFAALHDGSGYLAERYGFSNLTRAIVAAGDGDTSRLSVSAFGTSDAVGGFDALSGVTIELDGLVRNGDDYGLMPGVAVLNQDFTRDRLSAGLIFGSPDDPGLGIVHIASHFKLGKTDGDSFLLLGDGSHLTVNEIKEGAGSDFDFADVAMLTLSACDTAYASATSQGNELESFATVAQLEGARAVMASLWPIADISTAIFMHRFYELIQSEGMSRSAAMVAVQREFINDQIAQLASEDGGSIVAETARRGMMVMGDDDAAGADEAAIDFAHPYFWAPFLLMQGLERAG
jgi:CHAT domain-containing protein/TPR repeat protein